MFYCEYCKHKFRYTHRGYAVCLTVNCPNNPETVKK